MSVVQASQTSKQVCESDADRISNLPSIITERILECLPLQDAVRMSLLSTHWRYKWALLPQLILDEHFFDALLKRLRAGSSDGDFQVAFLNIVNNVLLRHIGPIRKFVLYIPTRVPTSADISHWIQFVSVNGVKEFTLFYCRYPSGTKLPSSLLSCVGLTHLTLVNCNIGPTPATFSGFPSVTSLFLSAEIDQNALRILTSCCPQLESLNLYLLNHTIIDITVHAPKLRDLVVFGSVSFIHLEETTKINMLSLHVLWKMQSELGNIFSSLPNVETLILTWSPFLFQICCYKEFPKLTNELGRLTTLKLVGISLHCPLAISLALCFFENSPSLQQLEIKVASTCGERHDDIIPRMEVNCNLQHLKNVKLHGISNRSCDLQLTKILLASSPVLEVMTIELSKGLGGADKEKLKIASELLRYRRASTNAEIIFESI